VEKFFEHICNKSKSGIPYSEAVQLMLWIYCILDFLPDEFRALKLTREELAKLFSRLSTVGKVFIEPETDISKAGILRGEIIHKEHWDSLVKKLLLGQISLDDSFRKRANFYV
jgi:hypothetical protein